MSKNIDPTEVRSAWEALNKILPVSERNSEKEKRTYDLEVADARRVDGLSIQEKSFQMWKEYLGTSNQNDLIIFEFGYRYSKVDSIVCGNNGPEYFLEVRGRRINHDTYRIFYVKRDRYNAFCDLFRTVGLKTCFLVIFNDAAAYIHLPNEFTKLKRVYDEDGKALDESDLTEEEKANRVYFFPVSEMKFIPDSLFQKYFGNIQA